MIEYKDKTKEQLVNELKRMHERILEYEELIVDELTSVYNIRRFLLLARYEYERALSYKRALSFIMLRPDNFKQLKKNHEDKIIDQILVTVAERCRTNVRSVDVLGRYGDEVFCLLLPESNLTNARKIAERIRLAVAEESVTTDSGPINITISLGLTKITVNTTNLNSLMYLADKAMKVAEEKGGNRIDVE